MNIKLFAHYLSKLFSKRFHFKVKLWHSPHNGGWIWFSKANLKRFDYGWNKKDHQLWWAIFGFSGLLLITSLPWSKPPCRKVYDSEGNYRCLVCHRSNGKIPTNEPGV